MPTQQQNQAARGPVRSSTKDSIRTRDGNTSGSGFTSRVRNLTFGSLFRVAAFVVRAFIPAKSVPEEDKRLLSEIRENDEHVKHHIARIIPLFRSSPLESSESHQSLAIPTLLKAIDEANLDPKEHFPLQPSESEILIDALQQKLSTSNSLSSSSIGDDDTRSALLRVLYWLTLCTGKFPKKMTITSDLECPTREDYGSGGMNDVLKGKHSGKLVALKHPRVIGMVQPSRRKKIENVFYRYSLVAFNMHHAHVLPVLGIVDEPTLNGFCMVLPWMAGGDLRNHLDGLILRQQLSGQNLVNKVDRWIRGIASGLSYLHRSGIVHGDVRGVNVLVDDKGEVRLTAFGSTALVAADDFSHPGQGSVAWVAPELIDPERYNLSVASPSRATDVYAFGCTCVELYTCESPFPGQREAQILNKVLKGQRPQRPNKPGEEMQEDLWQLVSSCWDSTSSKRPSIDDVLSRLTAQGSADQ